MPLLTQFESVKSMIRYLPPNGTAGFARTPESTPSRFPSPPARITATVRSVRRAGPSRQVFLNTDVLAVLQEREMEVGPCDVPR